ncbi:hypothetical protein [Methylobacterium sp. WL6]|uniref:hypothetical protein n=1 Tax=Methylobacterium sp. WL6 TaxID=2603901 RepID=UPI0011C99B94|nr:hypothetical protein [Methylobacterium sp. WL6]TXN64893.1 hypothetical protein FV230_17745 [Methylobacterium sp. WL6]
MTNAPSQAQIQAETEALAQGLRAAAHAAGLQPGDPLSPLVEALAHVIEHLGAQRIALALMMNGMVERVGDLMTQGREAAEAEAELFRATCAATEVAVVEQISDAIVKATDAALARCVRGGERRAGYRAALALFVALGLGAGSGWFLTDRAASTRFAGVEADVRAAFRESPETALAWADLMRWNDLKAALGVCKTPGEVLMQGGRRACRIPMWVAKPPTAQP